MPDDELPIILVSAADAPAAGSLISDLIGEDVDTETTVETNTGGAGARVWRIHNKYYSARVLVQAATGAVPADVEQRVQAHLVLLQPHEGVAELEARAAGGRRLPACDVRLALAAAPGDTLAAAARREGYEPVALADAAPEDDEDGAEARGLARAREALHSHVWPGLKLHAAAAARPPPAGDSDSEWEWRSADTDADRFASALGALGAARAAVAQAGPGRGQRLLRAEALLAAFCRALADPDPDER